MLINCPECEKEVSDSVKKCIHCGYKFIRPERALPKKRLFVFIASFMLVLTACSVAFYVFSYSPKNDKYIEAVKHMDNGEYAQALPILLDIDGFKDSDEIVSTAYEYVFAETVFDTFLSSYKASLNVDSVKRIWAYAIENDKDFDKTIKDFTATETYMEWIEEVNTERQAIDESMKILRQHKDDYKDAYAKLVELNSVYKAIIDMSNNPSGSFNSYVSDFNDNTKEFKALYEQISSMKPSVLELIKSEASNVE